MTIRVLLLMLALAALPAPARSADTPHSLAVSPNTLKWIKIPDMPECATAAILRGDPRSGPSWVLLRIGSGCRVPWHWHTPNEELVVISGQGTVEMQDGPPLRFVPGAYASLPGHHVHRMNCTRSCLFFNSADGAFDIHYVEPATGKELSLDDAIKAGAAKPSRKRRR